ncbi:MAG: TM0106 family RecB-like putative nuclease, partial [Actinobacteria bacterium]
MRASAAKLALSPSDLTDFLACEHLTALDLRAARHEIERTVADDPTAELIRRKGEEHEARYLAQLRAEGLRVTEIARDAAPRETEDAIRAGVADVIFQAHLVDGDWHGFADFLERQADGSYEVVDTKLARHAKPTHIFQLCFYSSVLARIQGAPAAMHLVLGDGRRESFRYTDFDAYYRRIRDRFLDFVRDPPETYPYPVEHCSVCDWRERCTKQWEDDDHLVRVANIRRKQIERLVGSGITTLEQLGEAAAEPRPAKIAEETFETLRQQAALQLHRRRTQEHKIDQLPLQEKRGLFGIAYTDGGEQHYTVFWARDESEEQRAFEQLVDWIVERRSAHPGLHVYHYANYERSALQRLMQKHGTREDEVDDLLRSHALVDLFQVVRQALRISVPSYSLKSIEELFFPPRETEVLGGEESTVVFERWLESGD